MIPFGKERPDPGTGGATIQKSLNAVLDGTGKAVPDRLAHHSLRYDTSKRRNAAKTQPTHQPSTNCF
ncbi:hypothetical protein GCM10023190_20770 [Enteractinococcus fodinae]